MKPIQQFGRSKWLANFLAKLGVSCGSNPQQSLNLMSRSTLSPFWQELSVEAGKEVLDGETVVRSVNTIIVAPEHAVLPPPPVSALPVPPPLYCVWTYFHCNYMYT
eukprot:5912208-Amphidinium_carterae.1